MSKYFNKVASDFDVIPLQKALLNKPELFGTINLRKYAKGSPHSQMTDIWVRYNDINKFPNGDYSKLNNEHDSVWYPSYYELPELRPIIFKLMSLVEGERLGGILITKISPGGRIDRHIDTGWHVEYYDKYYIPILNEDGSKLCFDDGEINPTLGDVWFFDNKFPHWVENNSTTDRIALIICIKSNRINNERNRNN